MINVKTDMQLKALKGLVEGAQPGDKFFFYCKRYVRCMLSARLRLSR